MDRASSRPVLTCADAKAWEANLLGNEVAEWAAMQAAGAAVARAVEEDFKEIGGLPEAARILVLVGKGHNGGDALLAAKVILEKASRGTADVILFFGEAELRPLARHALDELRRDFGSRVIVGETPPGALRHPVVEEILRQREAGSTGEGRSRLEGSGWALCLDGIFGFQFRAPMDATTAELIEAVNAHPGIRLRAAIDLPSGIGETKSDTVFRADFTYATGIVKQPAVSPAVASSVGRLRYLELGFFAAGEPPESCERILTAEVLTPLGALRASLTDKRTFGHLLVVGGSHSYPGAVVLAVRAALRSGVGLVTAFVPQRLAAEYAARYPEAMWVGCPETTKGGLAAATVELIKERQSRATALLMGPGMSAEPEVLGAMEAIVRGTNIPLVLDADALRPEVMGAAIDRPFIGTPHAGELQRITPGLFVDGELAAAFGVLVLKGPMTKIVGRASCATQAESVGHKARPPTYYSPFGGPVLARGGSGDILAGLIGGLLAQKPDDPLLAACRGVVWHGRAADLLARARGQVAVEISEILEQLGPALIS